MTNAEGHLKSGRGYWDTHENGNVFSVGGRAGGIKTPCLRGVSKTAPFFSGGIAPDVKAVAKVYFDRGTSMLTDAEQTAVAEYLKSL